MSGSLIPNGKQQYFDANGTPLAGGTVYYYIPYTTTAKNTWQDINLSILNTNPIILDAAGECIAWGAGAYRQQVYDVNNNLIWDQYTYGISPTGSNFVSQEEVQTATQGQTAFSLATLTYTPGINSLVVFVNGSKQLVGTNYTETSSTVVTFVTGLNAGDVVDFYASLPATAQNMSNAVTVAYDPPFTNSVATNVQAKLAQTISVKDFGAKGDGTTDDTTAIQNAINYVNSLPSVPNKPAIYFPSGRYLITSTIQLYSNITIYGDDRDVGYTYSFNHSSELIAGSAMGAMFDITGSNIYIGHLGLYGNTNANYGLYTSGTFGRASSNTFEQLSITLCQITGIYINNMGLTKIRNCQISNCLQCGIDGSGFGDADIEGCYINTINSESTSTVNYPSNATVYGVGIRLRSDPTSGNQSGNVNIRGGKIEFCRVGILINAAQGINITGIQFNVCRKASIYTQSDSTPLTYPATTYSNTTVSSIQITGNRFLGGLQGTQSPTAHIIISYSRYVTIVGNGFKRVNDAAADFYGTYPTQGPDYGIWLYNAELSTVVGNDLYGAAITNCIRVESANIPYALLNIYSNNYDSTALINAGTVVSQPSYGNINFVSGTGPVAINTSKAWVRFSATSSPTITSSFNVSNVTKVSAGVYQVNFTNALANNSFATFVSAGTGTPTYGAETTTSVIVYTTDGADTTALVYGN